MTTETDLYVCSKAGEPDCPLKFNGTKAHCHHKKEHKAFPYLIGGKCTDYGEKWCGEITKCIPVPKEPEAGQEG